VTTLIVGVSTRAMAQSAVRAGYAVRTVDYFGDWDQRQCCPNLSLRRDLNQPFSAWGLFRAAARDGVRPHRGVVYLANLENHPEVIAAFAARWPLLGNDPATVAGVRHWETLAAALASWGFRMPRTLPGGSAPPAGRWLRKPRRSGGGAGIVPWTSGPPGPDYVVQEYVPGRPCSVAFAADGRRGVILGISEQLVGRGEFGATGFRYCGNLFPLTADGVDLSRLRTRLQALVDRLVDRFGLRGVGGVDFVLDGQDPVVLEVNPRYTGAMELIERATGLSVFETHLCAAKGTLPAEPPAEPPDGIWWGKAIVFAPRAVVAGDPTPWLQRGICDVPCAGDRIPARRPVCTVLAQGPSRAACLATLVSCAREVYRDLYG